MCKIGRLLPIYGPSAGSDWTPAVRTNVGYKLRSWCADILASTITYQLPPSQIISAVVTHGSRRDETWWAHYFVYNLGDRIKLLIHRQMPLNCNSLIMYF